MPHLIVAGKKIALDFDFAGAVTIGRQISNSLPLPDPEVSRHHAQIFPREGSFVITDLGSHNGMTVNGRKITERVLKPNDEIILGTTLLLFDPERIEDCVRRLSREGRHIWQGLPESARSHFEPAGVSTYSHVELDGLISDWLDRKDPGALIPYKLRSDFLKLALSLDGETTRGGLCESALRFLQRRIGAQRALALAPGESNKTLDILAADFAPEVEEADRDIRLHKDILRIALDAQRAVFCSNCATDFRFKHIPAKGARYLIQSFLAVPVFAGDRFSAFFYLDQPVRASKYDFKCLAQAYLTGSLVGKCLHWRAIGRGKKDDSVPSLALLENRQNPLGQE